MSTKDIIYSSDDTTVQLYEDCLLTMSGEADASPAFIEVNALSGIKVAIDYGNPVSATLCIAPQEMDALAKAWLKHRER